MIFITAYLRAIFLTRRHAIRYARCLCRYYAVATPPPRRCRFSLRFFTARYFARRAARAALVYAIIIIIYVAHMPLYVYAAIFIATLRAYGIGI